MPESLLTSALTFFLVATPSPSQSIGWLASATWTKAPGSAPAAGTQWAVVTPTAAAPKPVVSSKVASLSTANAAFE